MRDDRFEINEQTSTLSSYIRGRRLAPNTATIPVAVVQRPLQGVGYLGQVQATELVDSNGIALFADRYTMVTNTSL